MDASLSRFLSLTSARAFRREFTLPRFVSQPRGNVRLVNGPHQWPVQRTVHGGLLLRRGSCLHLSLPHRSFHADCDGVMHALIALRLLDVGFPSWLMLASPSSALFNVAGCPCILAGSAPRKFRFLGSFRPSFALLLQGSLNATAQTCPKGYYSLAGAGACTQCPKGV